MATKQSAARGSGWTGGASEFMRRVLATEHGSSLYRKRQGMIEQVFADTKVNRRLDRYTADGRPANPNGG